MNKKSNRFSPEMRERAVRMVQEHRGEYPSLWAAIESIAPKVGCVPPTLLEWVKKAEVDSGAIGLPIISYRAPSFSFPSHRCHDLFSILAELDFKIDSSISTADRIHGGGHDKLLFNQPGSLRKIYGVDIFEIPVPGVNILGHELQIFGGGYLRITPTYLVNYFLKYSPYQVLYLHPHDFDRNLPSLPNTSFISNFRRRANVGNLKSKVHLLFANCTVRSCNEIFNMQ